MLRIPSPRWGRLKVICVALGLAVCGAALIKPLAQVASLALGAALLCFVAAPLARLYERRLSRSLSALLSLATLALVAAGLMWLLLPALLRELFDLARTLPHSIGQLVEWVDVARERLARRLPGVELPGLDLTGMQDMLSGLASGLVTAISGLADAVGQVSMAAVLAYFFLCDRDNLLLRLELLLPRCFRPTAVRMASAVGRELRLYLRGQLVIAGAVGLLSSAALLLVGVRSALALGPVIGLFNVIPYFGPYIGGIPAALIALGDGWQKAALTALALTAVQQLDGSWISPRVMGGVTGFSPALVLVGIYAGASLGGVAGMLFALPAMIIARTLFRIFVQKCENI